jgi:hypothetical protein
MTARRDIEATMTHLGWIFTFAGGILTVFCGIVCKYYIDQASKLKELIVEIRLSISDFENHRLKVSQAKALSNSPSDLKSKLELIPWYWYGLIRHLHLVRLPPKKKIYKAAKLLPRLAGGVHPFGDPQLRQAARSIAKEIKDLLA